MTRRYALRDGQWDRLKDLLPGRPGHVRVTAKDNWLFVEAELYRYRSGTPWRDLLERFGGCRCGLACLMTRLGIHAGCSRCQGST